MKLIISLFFIFLFSANLLADTWLQVGEDGYMIECPDAIELEESRYTIFNECYGVDPRNPVVEIGSYKLIENQVSFFEEYSSHESFVSIGSGIRKFKVQKNGKSLLLIRGEEVVHFKKLSESE